MKPNTGLTDAQRSGLVAILSHTLADLHVLYVQTRGFHWNVTGPHFNDLHKFFEAQYDELAGSIDEVAENIRYLGEKAPASMAAFLSLARIQESAGAPSSREMIQALLSNHESVARSLRGDIEKAGGLGAADVQDFLTGLLEQHDKMAWMLRAMLE
ncbi:MAG: DNA starvation/stationary phase protection protein [Acidobacteria bacterium]|nr:DNA starvation/stationary phase protection protein [Acidobacteriota bacterium]